MFRQLGNPARAALLMMGLSLFAARANATTTVTMTLAQMVEQSAAVVRMRVVDIDENAYDHEQQEPFTRVDGLALEVLVGAADDNISFLVRGGKLPNGDTASWGELDLVIGETYLLFLRAEYRISPILAAYREVVVDRKTVLVDEGGQLLDWTYDAPEFSVPVAEEAEPNVAVQKSRAATLTRVQMSARRPLRALPRWAQTRAQIADKIRAVHTFRPARKFVGRPSAKPFTTLEAP